MAKKLFDYQVEVDWKPAYELLVSLRAFAVRQEHKTLELGLEWVKSVRQSLHPDLAAELSSSTVDQLSLLYLLIWQSPPDLDAAGFIGWLGDLSAGDLYERLESQVRTPKLLLNLTGMRDQSVRLLDAWNEQYFRTVDPAILDGLRKDAAAMRDLARTLPAGEAVERITNGVRFTPEPVPETVVLIPQYHNRPWNLFDAYETVRLILYPAEALPAAPGEPPHRLVRLARALSDESRLRILHLLAERPLSFTDIVRATGLSKSTVHHHMVTLRASGLVRVETAGIERDRYTLRDDTLDDLGAILRSYLQSGTQGGHHAVDRDQAAQ